MKKLTLLVFSITFILTHFLFQPQDMYAQEQNTLSSSTQINLSDMIYADLAIRGYLDNVSVYYTDGTPANDIKLNETHHWLPASTVKTFAAMYAYKLISEGKLHLTDTVTIDAKNDVPTELVTDELPTLMIGDTASIDRLIRQMITQSDNTAFNQLLDVLGRDKITEYIQSLGLTQSNVGSKLNLDDSQTQYEYDVPGYGINSTTAEDYAKAFLLIKNNKIPGAKNLFTILAQQKINNMIPLLLPKTVICAHKTGDLDPLYHDGGICKDKTHSYVLTIFTNAGDPNLLAHLSQIAYTKDYQLVGQPLTNQPVSENVTQPIDELVMNQPKTKVLGVSTSINFPIPDITAADLGIKASDLSLIIPGSKLPQGFIPADSPFHGLSDDWQMIQLLVALGAQARMQVNLQTAQLRLAEAKDLINRGKTQEAKTILTNLQQGLNMISQDSTVQSSASNQTDIQAISETRFSLLGDQLRKTTGNAKLAIIKEIATEAKETIQHVQPYTSEAINATSPTQRPLIGTIVGGTSTTITVKTAGGQQITVPLNHTVTVKQENTLFPSPTPSENGSISPTPVPITNQLTVGTTVALVGSTVNNHFSPSFILAHVSKDLAAPEPVTVAKVDTKHNTLIVEENGIYTQVDINKDTTIKGANTNIPLKSIQSGDVVIVHGAPLTEVQTPVPSSITPTTSKVPSLMPSSITPATKLSSPSISNTTTSVPKVVPQNQKNSSGSASNPNAPVLLSPTPTISVQTKTTSQQIVTPAVIQGTSVEVIEKKSDIPSPSVQNSQPNPVQKTQTTPQQQPPAHSTQPKAPPAQSSSPVTDKNKEKKK